jgi:hypothetical protein
MGFYKTSYWIIGVTLISIYLIYVFMVYQEEKGKVSTIGGDKPSGPTSELILEDYDAMTNEFNLNNTEKTFSESTEYFDADMNHRRTSIINPINLLPQDSLKDNVQPMGLIYFRVKKIVYTEWQDSSIFQKILFVVESPIKLVV